MILKDTFISRPGHVKSFVTYYSPHMNSIKSSKMYLYSAIHKIHCFKAALQTFLIFRLSLFSRLVLGNNRVFFCDDISNQHFEILYYISIHTSIANFIYKSRVMI